MKSIFTILLFITILIIKPATAHAQAADAGDSLALVDLYDSTGGTAWTHHTNWLTTASVKTWYGVTLDSNGKVTMLSLDSNNLVGKVPSSLGSLTKIQYLYFISNKLSGQIPGAAFNNLTRIIKFDLEENYFTFDDINLLGGAFILNYMYISNHHLVLHIGNNNNRLSVSAGGTLSDNTYRWLEDGGQILVNTGDSVLRTPSAGTYAVSVTNSITGGHFSLYSNVSNAGSRIVPTVNYGDSLTLAAEYYELSGPSWTDQGGWVTTAPVKNWKGVTLNADARVVRLSLPGNNLTGGINSRLGLLTALTYLDFSNNHLSGWIYPQTYYLSLDTLILNNNQITGLYFTGSQPPSITGLVDIELAHNNLTGPVPNIFSKSHVATLNLSYNQLTGSVHCDAPYVQYLYLDHNNFSTNLGSISSKRLKVLDVSYNYLNWSFEPKTTDYIRSVLQFEPQVPLPLKLNGDILSVSAGYYERASYVDYAWYKGSVFLQTIVGDSTFKVTEPGRYSAVLTDELLPAGFRLFSDTFEVTAAELPVKLTTFTGQLTHGQAFLNWQTASELNSAYFGVQRSIDGTNFTTVGKVAAAGTSTAIKNYQYTDALTGLANMPAALYYRLQQVDKDGKQNLSKTIVLNPGANASSSLIMYPNPVRNLLNLRLKNIPGNAVITIVDAGGKTLLAQTSKTVTGGQTISLNTSRLAAGVYVVHVQYNGQSEEQQFVKE